MKIAILYSGLINKNIEEYYNNHYEYILSKYNDIDVYCSTYFHKNIDQCENNIDKFKEYFIPKILDIENWHDKESELDQIRQTIHSKATETNAINTLSMFYKIYKAHTLIDNQSYDIVIRNRTDIKFISKLELIQNVSINIPAGGDHRGGLLDLFAYGSQKNMKKYSSLFENIIGYINSNEIIFHPESLLRHHCKKLNLHINRFPYSIFLRNMNFTETAPCYY